MVTLRLYHLIFPPAVYEGSNFSTYPPTLVTVFLVTAVFKNFCVFIFGCIGSSLLRAGFL